MDDQSRDQLRFDRKICSKNLHKNTWILVLILCWSIVLFLAPVGGLALPYNILPFMCAESLAGSQDPLFCLFFSTTRDFCAGLLSFSKPKLGDFWCSFCACLLCFFERNLAISGARFVLVSCAFLNETWRFLVLVLRWSLVLF